MRIRWTLGAGPYYGPEYAPTALVLLVFPVLIACLAIGAHRLAAWLRAVDADGFKQLAPYYGFLVLLTLAVVFSSQTIIVVANL